MLAFLETMKQLGTHLVIAKGINSEVLRAFSQFNLAYGIAVGGAGAFYGTRIKQVVNTKYECLGAEGFFLVMVEELPFYVSVGGDVDGHFEPIP